LKSDQNHHNFSSDASDGQLTGVVWSGLLSRKDRGARLICFVGELGVEDAYSEVIETSARSCGTVKLPKTDP